MPIKISNSAQSWVDVDSNSDFPIQNLPFGIFSYNKLHPRVGIALGNSVIDLKVLSELGYLDKINVSKDSYENHFLNDMMRSGKTAVASLRERIYELFESSNSELRDKQDHVAKCLIQCNLVQMHLPIKVGDYTDFYSSREHATNVGTMFRDPNNALLPNWLHIPVGYHGRASSIILSGQDIVRPKGQQRPNDAEPPVFGPCKQMDFELEMAFVTFDGKPLGESVSTEEADEYIFGMCLFNDWSARDIQKWEYIPLGPFLAKNFASSMSPWIVTLEALEQFRIPGPVQDPKVFPYLEYSGNKHIDINLEVSITPPNGEETTISKSNYKHMYWNMNQQLAHHTVNGCNIKCGDMMASGTISGTTPDSYGSMLELAWKGTKPIKLKDGTERKFLNDGDTLTMKGHCQNNEVRIGFGTVKSKILPSN